jgi:hypothetical protein
MIKKINRLIVFGCSYCTGEEILYSELGPDLDQLHRSTADDPRIFFNKIDKLNLNDRLKEIQKKQMNLAWPKKLADALNIECLNLAESGNSMQKMLWQFLNQLHLGNIKETDLILFGLTKAERGLYFRESPMSFQISTANGPELNTILGISDSGGVSEVISKNIDIAIMHWFNDDRMIWDYLMVLNCLGFWKQKFNLFTIPAMSLNESELKKYNKKLFDSILDTVKNSDLYLTDKGLDHFKKSNDEYLPWGHPKEVIHSQYADHLRGILHERF